MEITANNGRFYVAMMHRGFEYKWNKDGTLSVWGGEDIRAVHVTTYYGDFIEAVNEAGEVICDGGDGQWFYAPIQKKPVLLRFKTLPEITLTKRGLSKARQIVTRYLISDKPYSLDLPDTLEGVIGWMQKQLRAIPSACRKKASFRFDTTMEYGETYPNVEITYREPETDEEVIRRLQVEAERYRIKTAKERAELEKLQKKFAVA